MSSLNRALCCHVSSLGGQHGNTSEKSGNTAGNTRATQGAKAPSLLELARARLGNTRATQAEKGRQHKASESPPCVATLSNDLRCVATWWAWSSDDLAAFKAWARNNHADAAAWVRQEAQTVRHYAQNLRCASVSEFIRPTETETPPQSPERKSSCL